jgi:hypothetical protein
MILKEEKIPYFKKSDCNVSKANKKSKHKHIYDKHAICEFTLKTAGQTHLEVYSYCSVCGKIEPLDWNHWKDFIRKEKWSWTKEDYLKEFPDAIYLKCPDNCKPYFDMNNINEAINYDDVK